MGSEMCIRDSESSHHCIKSASQRFFLLFFLKIRLTCGYNVLGFCVASETHFGVAEDIKKIMTYNTV